MLPTCQHSQSPFNISRSRQRCKICYTILVKPQGGKNCPFYNVNSNILQLSGVGKQIATSSFVQGIRKTFTCEDDLFERCTSTSSILNSQRPISASVYNCPTQAPHTVYREKLQHSQKLNNDDDVNSLIEPSVSCVDLMNRFLGVKEQSLPIEKDLISNEIDMGEEQQTICDDKPEHVDFEVSQLSDKQSIEKSSSHTTQLNLTDPLSHSDIICARCCAILLRMSELNVTLKALANQLQGKYQKTLRIISNNYGLNTALNSSDENKHKNELHGDGRCVSSNSDVTVMPNRRRDKRLFARERIPSESLAKYASIGNLLPGSMSVASSDVVIGSQNLIAAGGICTTTIANALVDLQSNNAVEHHRNGNGCSAFLQNQIEASKTLMNGSDHQNQLSTPSTSTIEMTPMDIINGRTKPERDDKFITSKRFAETFSSKCTSSSRLSRRKGKPCHHIRANDDYNSVGGGSNRYSTSGASVSLNLSVNGQCTSPTTNPNNNNNDNNSNTNMIYSNPINSCVNASETRKCCSAHHFAASPHCTHNSMNHITFNSKHRQSTLEDSAESIPSYNVQSQNHSSYIPKNVTSPRNLMNSSRTVQRRAKNAVSPIIDRVAMHDECLFKRCHQQLPSTFAYKRCQRSQEEDEQDDRSTRNQFGIGLMSSEIRSKFSNEFISRGAAAAVTGSSAAVGSDDIRASSSVCNHSQRNGYTETNLNLNDSLSSKPSTIEHHNDNNSDPYHRSPNDNEVDRKQASSFAARASKVDRIAASLMGECHSNDSVDVELPSTFNCRHSSVFSAEGLPLSDSSSVERDATIKNIYPVKDNDEPNQQGQLSSRIRCDEISQESGEVLLPYPTRKRQCSDKGVEKSSSKRFVSQCCSKSGYPEYKAIVEGNDGQTNKHMHYGPPCAANSDIAAGMSNSVMQYNAKPYCTDCHPVHDNSELQSFQNASSLDSISGSKPRGSISKRNCHRNSSSCVDDSCACSQCQSSDDDDYEDSKAVTTPTPTIPMPFGNSHRQSFNYCKPQNANNYKPLQQQVHQSPIINQHLLTADGESCTNLKLPIDIGQPSHLPFISSTNSDSCHLPQKTVNHSGLLKFQSKNDPFSQSVAAFQSTNTNQISSSPISSSILQPTAHYCPTNDASSLGNSGFSSPTLNEKANTPVSMGLLSASQIHSRQVGTFKRYQCGYCGKVVTNIQIHVRRHTNEKPYTCQYCDKRFTNSGDLQIHTRIHTGEKPYRCPLCGKSYRTIGNFNSHVKTHDNGERPHKCSLCNETFEQMRDWFSHLRSSHKQQTSCVVQGVVGGPVTTSAAPSSGVQQMQQPGRQLLQSTTNPADVCSSMSSTMDIHPQHPPDDTVEETTSESTNDISFPSLNETEHK